MNGEIRPHTQSFQKPYGVGVIKFDPHAEHGPTVFCSCGWKFRHRREKVREDRVDSHLAKKHRGGIRL